MKAWNKALCVSIAALVLVVIGLCVAAVSLFWALVLTLAWNIFLHELFHLPEINLWQGWALTVLLAALGSLFRRGK